jgi:hypothetical protein
MGTVATGVTVGFSNGFLGEIISVEGPTMSRPNIDMTVHSDVSDGFRKFAQGKLVDGGSLDVTIAYDGTTAPPIKDAEETVTLTFPDSGITPWTFPGGMSDFAPSFPLEERLTARVSIKCNGVITGI